MALAQRITAKDLVAGDTVKIGNVYRGFETWNIIGVAPSRDNKRKVEVFFEITSGALSGVATKIEYGKNAIFFRI